MNIPSFFSGLRRVQDTRSEAISDVRAEHAVSARLISTAEYELEALRRDLRQKVGGPTFATLPGRLGR